MVVIGGAFSGASTALLLNRWLPDQKILVVESSEAFGFKVGEATVEISSFFLHRVLGLHGLLAQEHLPKHGLRYWFSRPGGSRLEDMSEIGPSEVPRVPAFQLDRSRLDQSLLELAESEGVEVLRPAKVTEVETDWPATQLTVETGDGSARLLDSRWVVDASGRHAFLARRKRLRRRLEEHPTAAVWARWTGVRDFDGPEILGADPLHPKLPPIAPARRLATNHFCGRGWWAWMIPLRGGETSIGVVYDKRLFSFPEGVAPRNAFEGFIRTQSGLRDLVAGAELVPGDLHSYSHLPYTCSQYMDLGWALVGDAASFLDPFYSPGLDHAALSIYSTARIVRDDLRQEVSQNLSAEVDRHNELFARSIPRWLHGIYIDKYELFGDAELTGASFLLDTSLYYMGVVTPIHDEIENLEVPVFGLDILPTKIAYAIMRFYSRRLVKLARKRVARGDYGRYNEGLRVLARTAGTGPTESLAMLRAGLKLWLRAELSAWLPVRRDSRTHTESQSAGAA